MTSVYTINIELIKQALTCKLGSFHSDFINNLFSIGFSVLHVCSKQTHNYHYSLFV